MLKNMKICVVYSLFFVYVTVAEVNDDAAGRVEQSLDTVPLSSNNTSKLTKAFQDKHGKLTVDPANVPPVRQGEIMLQEMCETNGGNGSYQSAQDAVKNIENCFNDIIVFSKLPSQIEEARPKGNLDQVFNSYCHRTDEFKGCVHKFLVDVDPCLGVDQKSSKYTIQNITDAILKFACENEGDYIALFISEKGPQCISSKQPGIERCIKQGMNESKTYEMYEKMKQNQNLSDLNLVGKEYEKPFSFAFELEQCRTAYRIRTCIIEELKTCSGSTPANVVESIFNLIQKSTTCAKYSQSEIDPTYSAAAASSMFTSIFSVVIPAVTILVARTFSS